jgi:coenzyme PQQ biosynthesis protein PqqD
MNLHSQPRLADKVRLRFDRHSGKHLLIYPERGMQLDAVAAAIAEQCDGVRTVAQIVSMLAERFAADPLQVEGDVLAFLGQLHDRCLVIDAAAARGAVT